MKVNGNLFGRAIQVLFDGGIFVVALVAAFLIRFEGKLDNPTSVQLVVWLPILVSARCYVNWKLGIYRFIWRYVSLSDAIAIGRSLSVVTLLLLLLRFSDFFGLHLHALMRVPVSVIALEYFLSLTGSLGARALRRIQYEHEGRPAIAPTREPERVLLFGAGKAGIALARDLESRSDVDVVGFLDDDPQKAGSIISTFKVLGTSRDLEETVRRYGIGQVVISIVAPSRETIRRTFTACKSLGVAVKIIPSLQELYIRHASISQIHEVQVEDLLGRDGIEVTAHEQMIREMYSRKRILITGAGGSIGSELVRQLVLCQPQALVLLDKDENALYELEQELRRRSLEVAVQPYVGDIRNRARLETVFEEFRPQIVFHAAAYKHVPLMESNPCEAVLNNVLGTQILLEVCFQKRLEAFVYISTDKAVNPTSVMGATKRIGEAMVQEFARRGLPAACVRFGNVLGSRGSVIPLFQRQIAQGGPITVTHPDVTRYFMTIPEAVRLVLCAGSLGSQGETYVLDMGSPRKIVDVAHELVTLAGLQPGRDIEIQFTGLRPGEKLCEELVESGETLHRTPVEKLLMVLPSEDNNHSWGQGVERLVHAAAKNDGPEVHEVLTSMGICFLSESSPRAAGPLQKPLSTRQGRSG